MAVIEFQICNIVNQILSKSDDLSLIYGNFRFLKMVDVRFLEF